MPKISIYIVFTLILFLSDVSSGEEATTPVGMTERQRALLDMLTPDMLEKWDKDDGLEKIIRKPTANQNAAEFFRKLCDMYPQERLLNTMGVPYIPHDATGIDELYRAGVSGQCDWTDIYPPLTAGDSPQPEYIAMSAYGRASLEKADRLTQAGRLREAEMIYHATLNAGRHLTTDGPSLVVYMAGLSMKLRAAVKYANFLEICRRKEDAEKIKDYSAFLDVRQKSLAIKAQVCLGEFEDFNCLYAVIKVAEEDKSLFWRQEALIRLGILRWGAPTGDLTDEGEMVMTHDEMMQDLARKTLEKIHREATEPSLKKLALWVFQTLTPEKFMDMREQLR